MNFTNPWAFLFLLAIPVLIVIYIFKNKYKESTSSSTYIWELSKKFLKHNNPIRKIEHLLNLILQCICVLFMSITLAHPTFTLKNSVDDVIFVLDNTASMNIVHEGKSRFALAKEKILEKVNNSTQGTKFTLINSSDESETICKNVTDKSRFEMYLNSLESSFSSANLDESLAKAQEMFSTGESNVCYLVTDKQIQNHENVSIIDVSDDEINYAINDLTYTYKNSVLSVTTTLTSYGQDDTIGLSIYINDNENPILTNSYELKKDTELNVTFEVNSKNYNFSSISSIRAEIDKSDSLMYDNSFICYNNDSASKNNILLVSNQPIFLEGVINAFKGNDVTTIGTSDYSYSKSSGYDIVIFDSFNPGKLPKSNAVWFFGLNGTIDGTGFISQGNVEISDLEQEPLSYTNDDSLLYKELTKDTQNNEINVKKYVRYSLTSDFTTILTFNNLPFVFAGKNEDEQRQVVFSFDVHDSNITMKYDFIPLIRNFLNYSNPKILSEYNYKVGESVSFSVSDNVEQIEVQDPNDEKEKVQLDGDYSTYRLDSVGTYYIRITYPKVIKSIFIYASFPQEESNPLDAKYTDFSLGISQKTTKSDGIWDNILPFAIVCSILFALDWIMYSHEQR